MSTNNSSIRDAVKEYYSQTLQSTEDLKTTACCDVSSIPNELREPLNNIHPEVLSRYYGCGLIAPCLLNGLRILDLGCGSGRDVYLLSQLVGKDGEVIGVDMTSEQLDVAKRHAMYHADIFGYENFNFVQGYIEQLDELNLEPASFDVVISNCVVNLSSNKNAVFSGIKKLLKPGGEFYFSDVYADRRIPSRLQNDPLLYGECLSGSLYWNDFIRIAKREGFQDPRLVCDRPLVVTDPELTKRLGPIKFHSATYRLFNIPELEDACEDYGQAVIYKGTIPNNLNEIIFDKHHRIEKNKVFPVCGNTYRMLSQSRFLPHFDFKGNFNTHCGIFDNCGMSIPFQNPVKEKTACC